VNWRHPQDREAIPVLIEVLKDCRSVPSAWETTFQDAALACLANFRGEAAPAVPVLRKLLVDREPGVREKTAQVLGLIGPQARSAIPGLMDGLMDRDPKMRAAAANGLGGIGPEARVAASLLRANLKDPDKYVRASSAAALGGIRAQEAIPALKAVLKDKEWEVRRGGCEDWVE
jgi:HEAT repeat protein